MGTWKKGRGTLGFLQPLIGAWTAEADSPMGPLRCRRVFAPFGDQWIRLDARWEFDAGAAAGKGAKAKLPPGPYLETAYLGRGDGKAVGIWSFTSDGKRSQGAVADVRALHPEAIGFAMRVPAGTARQAYWPEGPDGFVWVVEAKTAKGWRRFTEHHYRRDGT